MVGKRENFTGRSGVFGGWKEICSTKDSGAESEATLALVLLAGFRGVEGGV